MVNMNITIPLDPETARAYESAGIAEKRRIQFLLSVWLRQLTTGKSRSLEEILDEAGRQAQERGLTPEILESLLRDE